MKKILLAVLFLAIIVTPSSTTQKRKGAGAVDDFLDNFFEKQYNLKEFLKFYEPMIEKMKPVWVKREPDQEAKEAGWVEEYEVNNKDIYVSIAKGTTLEKKQKMAFNASFKEKQIICHCYFEDGRPMIGSSENLFACEVFLWLLKKGFFETLPPLRESENVTKGARRENHIRMRDLWSPVPKQGRNFGMRGPGKQAQVFQRPRS